MTEDFLLSLDDAQKHLKTADHMIYVTFPIVKEKRILIKVLEEIYKSVSMLIKTILQYEYHMKRIKMHNDEKMNFEIFRQRCASRYNIKPEQTESIKEILMLAEKHKQSPFEFTRNDRFVIMSDNLKLESINIEKLKGFLAIIKDVVMKVNASMSLMR
jgi:hypothetical protein